MGTKTDVKLLKPFIRAVKKEFAPAQIILYGSRAKGTAHKDSDYDIIVISPAFKHMNFLDRGAKLYYMKRNVRAAMDIIGYTPEEFKKQSKKITLIREIAQTGKDITDL